MGKDYLTDLREWVKQKKGLNGNNANSARVVFLAIREDVKNAIDAGYSLTTIWEHMHETGRVTTTYETFRRHVRRYIYERAVIPEKKPVIRVQSNPGSQLPAFHFKPPKKGTD